MNQDDEIKILIKLTYQECFEYLQNKYGIPKYNYFSNNQYKSKNPKNSRTNEGLVIHHIDEDKAIMLSDVKFIKLFNTPFKFQLKDRLVYCNLIEHLLLHIKIVEQCFLNKNFSLKSPLYPQEVGIGGIINFLIPEINDIYSGIKYQQKWKLNCANKVLEYQKQTYFNLVLYLLEIVIINDDLIKRIYLSLLRSFNQGFGLWNVENNKDLQSEILEYIWDSNEKLHLKCEKLFNLKND